MPTLPPWPSNLAAAKAAQETLRSQVVTENQLGPIRYVAGTDVGFKAKFAITQAAVVVLTFPELELVESAIARCPTRFPYIPGYLSFREVPALLYALEQLTLTPDLIFCDGQGLAHPRRFGLACHLGVLCDRPTIGVAKSRLIGEHEAVAHSKGSWQPLTDQDETIGAVLRSRTNVKPLYISIGHRINLVTALDYVQQCLTRYRLPETTRLADKLASGKA